MGSIEDERVTEASTCPVGESRVRYGRRAGRPLTPERLEHIRIFAELAGVTPPAWARCA